MYMVEKKKRRLDFSKLSGRKSKIVSSEEALKDVTPINWSKDVLSGDKKINIISKN
nr:MAG TPA: hypothetical protein [Caudoviricetes sp.]